ncbi:Rossmann-like and DUF2520 domain-containing protein [Acinetobacter gerneri]|uniref:DUF2520 domain-containing protein n=1 Tax=Acinetobacter gerneri DSM 14967 = CIP 107464 = MTCC 9824 TaxID=1120926 RepID=N8ZMC6_9GAMM|nr:Rossmann-like and DUF2520 domain-containing protein [Acinetobacter gerneri]ENV32640.1 hypothetical protein F960_03147 [Acinetobacter gerneri DSM 14967 = CIP 107464 = MTCC 9824]EPR84548.1 hypothetical protein L289_1303 [Acinetobacter gerneri DSM 14967 = CIP 107464 = MTCC 9824]
MRISFIGSGRVATKLALALSAQHEIVQILSQNIHHAEKLAQLVSAQATHCIAKFEAVDLVIIAISDQAIEQMMQKSHFYFADALVVHTSGSTSLQTLSKYYTRSGVFYPLQTFSFERDIDWKNTPIFIETARESDLAILQEIAASLSQRVYCYSSEQRLSLHLAAVFACNFTNYCYDMAKQIVDQKQVDFSLLYPLIMETALKATQNDPYLMQTGPAKRGDANILNMHQTMLEKNGNSDLQNAYELMSNGILKRHH